MMKYYLDITLLPDAEANLGFLWQKVYQQIHLALAENKLSNGKSAIAVSFPKYIESPNKKEFPLGDKLRLLAPTQDQLQQLNVEKWLNRLSDYTHCTSIKEVPATVNKFVCFKRKQFKSSEKVNKEIEKWAPKLAKKLNKPLDETLNKLKAREYKNKFTLPFLNIESLSSDRKQFKLFIEKEMIEKPKSGEFNCYGLSYRESSKTASVPWFK